MVVQLLFLALYANVYKHIYGDFPKDEKEYQDTICSEAEEGNSDRPWEVLYGYVVSPAASQPDWGDIWGIPLTERTLRQAFLELVTAGKHTLRPLWILFCVLQRSLLPC